LKICVYIEDHSAEFEANCFNSWSSVKYNAIIQSPIVLSISKPFHVKFDISSFFKRNEVVRHFEIQIEVTWKSNRFGLMTQIGDLYSRGWIDDRCKGRGTCI